jgi:hypothetical protein
MSAVDGSPVSTGSGRVLVRSLWPGPGGPRRYCGWGEQMIGPVRRPRHYVLAAGVAVAIALGPSWRVHAAGITPGAVANRHLIGVTVSAGFAGMGGGRAGCRAAPAVAPGYGHGQYLSQRGVDHLRRRPAGAQLAAGVRSQAWRAGDQSRPEQSAATPVRGLRDAMAGPGISCPSASRWPEAGFRDMSFTYPAGAARADIQTLACREWAAGEPARPPHGGCMAEGIAERMQRLYAVPAAPEKSGIFRALGTGPESGAGEVRGQLRGIFSGDPALAYVMFRVHEQDGGVTIPARACGAAGGSGGQLSCGDRASLPGRSTRYRIVWLVCAQCGTRMAWLFYDERDIPLCVNPPHGQLELQR